MRYGIQKAVLVFAISAISFDLSEGKDVASLKLEYEVFEEEIRKNFQSKRESLYDNYAAAVRRQLQAFQQQGNLEAVLAAQKEAELAEKQRKHSEADFPEAGKLRGTLQLAMTQIDAAESDQYQKLRENYIALGSKLQVELTKNNQIDEAVKARDYIQQLKEEIESAGADKTQSKEALPPAIIVDSGETRKLNLSMETFSNSVLNSKKPVSGTHELRPGRYRSFSSLKLGDRSHKDKNKRKAILTIPSGSEITNGHIFIDIANLELSGSYFTEIRFGQNLHSSFKADSCIFTECTFGKEGGWSSGLSSRWTFENCVISTSFFRSWRKKQVGVQIRNCTFEEVDFEPYQFIEDAGKEAANDWYVFEHCLFRNCTIPESILLGTRECAFENCKIVSEDLEIKTNVSITLYERNSRLTLPRPKPQLSYTLASIDDLGEQRIGSNLDYTVKAKRAVPNP